MWLPLSEKRAFLSIWSCCISQELCSCWWKELTCILAVLGLVGWRNIILVSGVIHCLVRFLFWLLLYTWYMTYRNTEGLLIVLRLSSSMYLFTVTSYEISCRQSRTTGEPSSLCKSVELCSNNRRLPCVEWWFTPDQKWRQVEMSCVLLMGWVPDIVQLWSGNVCVCVSYDALRSTSSTTGGCVCKFSVFATTVLMLCVQ